MTTQKDFKRLVRGRMQKTGETYTAARATMLRKWAENGHGAAKRNGRTAAIAPSPAASGHAAQPAQVPVEEFPRLAGMSDEKVKEKTGCTWERWVWALDQVNAQAWPHRDIALYVHEKYKVPGWWAQAVTVGYERIRGLREKGQRRSGSWEASKSRTIDAAAGRVHKAFTQPKVRRQWLDARVTVRSKVPNKSARLTWEDDGSSVEVFLTPKGRSRTAVSVAHTRLASKQAAADAKAWWAERLDALADLLAPPAKT